MADCKAILEKAKALYDEAHLSYRDSMLSVGKLLHEFVYKSLKACDGKSHDERWKENATRESLIYQADERMEIGNRKINVLIKLAMTVDLFSDGEGIGNLGLSSIEKFSNFVRRKTLDVNDPAPMASCQEEWFIEPAFIESSKSLFRECIKNNLGIRNVTKAVNDLLDSGPKIKKIGNHNRGKSVKNIDCSFVDLMENSASVAAPGDVADMCLDLIRKCSDPNTAAVRLWELLREFMRVPDSKKRSCA